LIFVTQEADVFEVIDTRNPKNNKRFKTNAKAYAHKYKLEELDTTDGEDYIKWDDEGSIIDE
jgi:hypothetical protein